MMFLPLVFKTSGMRCLIVGGGDIAWHKLELLVAMECSVTVVSPRIHEGIQNAVDNRGVRWFQREFAAGDCQNCQLVVAATQKPEVNRTVSEESKSLGISVNVVDDLELCTIIFPAVWRQGPLTVSVSTEGVAPYMAAAVRDRLASTCAPLARWVETAARFRAAVRSEVSDWNEKNLLYWQFVNAITSGESDNPPSSMKLSDWMAWLSHAKEQGK